MANAKFALLKLPATVKRERRGKHHDKRRFFITTSKIGNRRFVCGYGIDAVNYIRERNLETTHDTMQEIPDDFDAALKMVDNDRVRAGELLGEIAKHVSEGHYNSQILERLRSICEIEGLDTAEAILASATPREGLGPIEEWCLHALQCYSEIMLGIYQTKRSIEERLLKESR